MQILIGIFGIFNIIFGLIITGVGDTIEDKLSKRFGYIIGFTLMLNGITIIFK